MRPPFYERPCAAEGLISYRYRAAHRNGNDSFIMVGAKSHGEAMAEVRRSFPKGELLANARLDVWNGTEYVPAYPETA